MKKLLKSILIATTSIGVLAGSTAAVVSCGTTPDKPAPTSKATADDYLAAMAVIETHFITNDIFVAALSQTSETTVITGMIQQSILDFITTYIGGGALTDAQKASFKPGLVLSDITVAYIGTLEKTPNRSYRTTATNGFTITIKASSPDIQGAAKPFIDVDYSIITDYLGAMEEIQYHFSTRPILDLSATEILKLPSIQTAVQESVANYINDTTSEGHLLKWQRDAFKTGTINGATDIQVGLGGEDGIDTSVGLHKTSEYGYITISIVSVAGLPGLEFKLKNVSYNVK